MMSIIGLRLYDNRWALHEWLASPHVGIIDYFFFLSIGSIDNCGDRILIVVSIYLALCLRSDNCMWEVHMLRGW